MYIAAIATIALIYYGNEQFELWKLSIMTDAEQQFLNELDTQLWKAADKLRSNLDAANYKHVVLGLIFLKYVSDAFEERQNELMGYPLQKAG